MTNLEEISSAQLETIYRVMLKRVAKGYTAKHLSYLIGKDDDYVGQVESFNESFYSSIELEKIAKALEENNIRSFYPRVIDETILSVEVERHWKDNMLSHIYSLIDEQDEKCQLFMIREDIFEDSEENMESSQDLELAIDAIMLLIRADYFFEAKMPFEVFHAINRLLTVPLSPFYLKWAISRFCADEDSKGPLNRIEKNNEGYCYEEV